MHFLLFASYLTSWKKHARVYLPDEYGLSDTTGEIFIAVSDSS